MASKEGKTLYTFDKDAAGKSNCNGGCAAAWPPFIVANPALVGGDFSIVKRDDGAAQWAYKGKPLYFFAGDAKAGDVNGDNQGGVWHVIRNEPKKTSAAPEIRFFCQLPIQLSYFSREITLRSSRRRFAPRLIASQPLIGEHHERRT